MKPQDILFLAALVMLLYKRSPRLFAIAGLVSLIIAIPLYYQWIFFTAQRLVVYAFIFFLLSLLFHAKRMHNNK